MRPEAANGEVPLTDEELDEIEELTDKLYELANVCAAKKLSWHSEHPEVHDYLAHANEHFPGKHVKLLLLEVDRLREMLDPAKLDTPFVVDRPHERKWNQC